MTLLDALFGTHSWRTVRSAVVTDVTRMQGDRVCIAAHDGRGSIRLHEPPPTDRWLDSIRSLAPGDVISVECRSPRQCQKPHVEDRVWNPTTFQKLTTLPASDLADRLSQSAFGSIKDAFGKPRFYSDNGNAAFAPGRGSRSLASLVVSSVRVYLCERGIRVDFVDDRDRWTMAPLEDLSVRRHQAQCTSCRSSLASLLSSEFGGSNAVLRVGVGRPFEEREGETACWLQVNHVFPIPPKKKHFVYQGARP